MIRNFRLVFLLIIISCGSDNRQEIFNTENGLKRVIFFPDGNIMSEVLLEDDKPNGTEKIYYSSGRLKSELDWILGKKRGHQFEYFDKQDTVIMMEKGEPVLTALSKIKSYNYINSLGGISYTISYQEDGTVEKQEGSTVVAYAINKENIVNGDTIQLEIQFPLIECSLSSSIYNVKSDSNYEFIDSLKVLNNFMISEYPLIVDSKKTLAIISELEIEKFSKVDTSFINTINPLLSRKSSSDGSE